MNIYSEVSYKDVLKKRVRFLKEQQGSRYSFRRLAESSGAQQTFLSRVFQDSKAHLNADQLFHALEFLEFGPSERKFITLLYERDRSTSPSRRQVLKMQIESLRKSKLSTKGATNVNTHEVSSELESLYFLDPEAQALHILLMLPKFSDEPEKARLALGLPFALSKNTREFDWIESD